MPTEEQWRKACDALDSAVIREILTDNPSAGKLISRRLRRASWRPAALLTAPASSNNRATSPPLVLITAKPRTP